MSLLAQSVVALGILGGAAIAQGTPRSVGECERLKNDLAYNQCLAMFGPVAKNVAGGYAAGEMPTGPAATALPAASAAETAALAALPQVEEPAVEEGRRGRRGYRSRRGGRQSASFSVGGGGRAYRRRRR